MSAGQGPWAVSDMWSGNSECGPLAAVGYFQYGNGSCQPIDLDDMEAALTSLYTARYHTFPEAATDPWEEQG